MFFTASIALGQEAQVSEPNLFQNLIEMITSAEGLAKLVAFAIALQLFLRGMAEALTRISDYTETTWDNKAAAWLSQAAWVLGSILGKFGYGTPKLVVEEIKNKDA